MAFFAKKCRSKADFAPTCPVVPKKMQTRSRCAAIASEDFTTYRKGEIILDSPKITVQNTPANSKRYRLTITVPQRFARS